MTEHVWSCAGSDLYHCAGTLLHEFLHLMGHQHHAYGTYTSFSYLTQTFIYTAGDCIASFGDFEGTRSAGSQSTPSYSSDYSYGGDYYSWP